MTRVLVVVLCLAGTAACAARTSEVLVTTAGVAMPALSGRGGIQILNYGPNPLQCAFGTSITGNAFFIIPAASGDIPGEYPAAARDYHAMFCRAVTANQISGAATIVNELDYP